MRKDYDYVQREKELEEERARQEKRNSIGARAMG